MKSERFSIEVGTGKKRVKLEHDGYTFSLLTMRNGFQWSGATVDDEILEMIKVALEKYECSEYIDNAKIQTK